MRTYVCTYIHTHIHTYMHVCMRTYVRTYIHSYIHPCIHTCIHPYIHTCIHTYRQTYITYIHTHMDTHGHTWTHKHTHTHVQALTEHFCTWHDWLPWFEDRTAVGPFPTFSLELNFRRSGWTLEHEQCCYFFCGRHMPTWCADCEGLCARCLRDRLVRVLKHQNKTLQNMFFGNLCPRFPIHPMPAFQRSWSASLWPCQGDFQMNLLALFAEFVRYGPFFYRSSVQTAQQRLST